MAILLREMRSRGGSTCIRKVSSPRGRPLSLSLFPSLFSSLCLPPLSLFFVLRQSASCLIDGTRVAHRLFFFFLTGFSILLLSFRFPGSDKESVSGDNLGSYRSSARWSKVRYIGAVKLVPQKRCPKGSASCADKATILRFSECTRLSPRARSFFLGFRLSGERERERDRGEE